MKTSVGIILGLLVLGQVASADTLILNSGARIDGVVRERGDGLLEVKAGDRTVVYRPEEIASREVNDRKGGLDMAEVRARVAATQARLDEETGVTQKQRERVDELITDLASADKDSERVALRNRLVDLQQEFNVYRYLTWRTGYGVKPGILEVMYNINPSETMPILRRATQDSWFETREMAVALLGRLGASDAADLVVRGMADHAMEVRLAAIGATANLKALAATPVLIEQLGEPDQRIANASRLALEALWASKLAEGTKHETASDWQAFWETQPEAQKEAFAKATLQPLIPEADELVFE